MYNSQLEEHMDFHYASESEMDREAARLNGYARPDCAWILSPRDVWYPNPAYVGPPQPHPEEEEHILDLIEQGDRSWDGDIPF